MGLDTGAKPRADSRQRGPEYTYLDVNPNKILYTPRCVPIAVVFVDPHGRGAITTSEHRRLHAPK